MSASEVGALEFNFSLNTLAMLIKSLLGI